MALDRTSLSVKTSFQRRPAAASRVQRAVESPQSIARALQERLGNRATQMFVARSMSRSGSVVGDVSGAGSKSEKTCAPGSCECATCQHAEPKTSARGLGQAASAITPEPKPEASSGNVLQFPAITQRRPSESSTQIFQPGTSLEKTVVGEANELSSTGLLPSTRNVAPHNGVASSAKGQPEASEPQTAPRSPQSRGGRGQVVISDTARSEAMIKSTALALHQRVSGFFGGIRARLTGFFTESTVAVMLLIASKQAEIVVALAETIQSVHAAIDRAATAAEAIAGSIRGLIDTVVQSLVGSLQTQVQKIVGQIIGVIDRFPQSSLPGVSQLRSAVAGVLSRAASAVTAGLSRVTALISAALALGMRVIQTIIGAARRVANAVVAGVGTMVQRIVQLAFGTLSRLAASIGTALQTTLNITIMPILNRVESVIHQAIRKAERDAISALRKNRDEYLASLGSGDASDGEAESDDQSKEALEINKEIVDTFRERASSGIARIVQFVTTVASQIVAHFRQLLLQVRQFVGDLIRQVIQTFTRIVQVVSSFIQRMVEAVRTSLMRVVGFVRTLIERPLDQLVKWAREILTRMLEFIARIARNLLNFITGAPPQQATGQFVPTPTLQPTPTFDPGPIPIPVPIPIPIPKPTPTPTPPPLLLLILIAIIILIIIIILIYLLYRWIRGRRRKKRPPEILHKTKQRNPGSRKRLIIGVGEEVFLEYTHGSTTWATSGGVLSSTTGAKVRLDAPDTAGTITVTAGTAPPLAFQVIAPSGVAMTRLGGMKHDKNVPNSGIKLTPHLLPDTVNFYRVTFHEMDVPFTTATGYYSCNPFSTGHCGRGGGNVPCADLDASNKVVRGKGTKVLGFDCAYSGFCPGNPLTPGQVSGNIPHEYKVNGPSGGGFHAFPSIHQVHTLEADAVTLTSSKGGASGSLKISDSTRRNGC